MVANATAGFKPDFRPDWLYGGNAIPGHCHLAGPPPGGRTSGRPFHARVTVWMAG
jgi:hypothetical protein